LSSEIKETNFSKKDKHTEATLDNKTCEILNISKEDWDKMSYEEKEKNNVKALKQIVDNNNSNIFKRVYDFFTGGKITYASQYKTYAQRCTSEEEMARLASAIKSLDKETQYETINSEIEYRSEKLKDIADKVMATEYVEYIEENQVAAIEKLVKTASEENIVLAAENSTKADVKQQEKIVDALMSANIEKVDTTIASKQGQYGIDKDGKKDAEVEKNIYQRVIQSNYEKVLEIVSKNIEKLAEQNRETAKKIIGKKKRRNKSG